MKRYIKHILSWLPWISLGLIISALFAGATYNAEDSPKRKVKQDTVKVDTSVIQMEQMIIQEETKNRMGKWDSLLMKQDSLIKKK